ncbi:hypothetical protein J7400_12345 [Shimia sp. R9_2]|uniref:hypothetical protein n=1 Tax=Shimia sp. R9_2 TaxID=2821112 RepID=UPI001ADC5971|nr:hypothetical protein [Shimia sp. R9_2]MBO9397468.1 hypothetical protein [Shimia sp. R9_2]
MVMVAIGAAKLRHWWDTPRFVAVAILSLRHTKRSAGNLHAEVFPYASHFFSLTVWQRAEDIKRFATTGPHRMALRMRERLTEASRFHVFESEAMPEREVALSAWYAALPAPLQRQMPVMMV